MRTPIRLEDIDEFNLVRRIPRNTINEDILHGVRGLDEAKELEPFLRSILPDVTKTPHTSSEIADILTTHLTYSAVAHLTAFVNKGKSYAKVTAKEVSYQIIRLRSIPNLGFVVLLAVGDIYDDAKRDFLQIAEDAGVDFMIVDAIDVARLFIAYQKVCPKDGSPFIQGRCLICGASVSDPVELTLNVHEDLRFSVLSQTDVSHGLAKRYRANILTDPHYPKAAIREIIKTVVWQFRTSTFHGSKQLAAQFRGKETDCVFLFIYVDMHDRPIVNWICRVLWISPSLPENARPLALDGNEMLGDIEIDWKTNYDEMRQFAQFQTKEEWVQTIERLLPKLEHMETQVTTLMQQFAQGQLRPEVLSQTMAELEPAATALYQEGGDGKLPPLECEECDLMFQLMTGVLHDMYLPFASWSQADWDFDQKIRLIKMRLDDLPDDKANFFHEWKKIRS